MEDEKLRAGLGNLTVPQSVKAHGGSFRTELKGGWLHVVISAGETSFSGKTTLDVVGLRTIEKLYGNILHEVQSLSPAVCGVTLGVIGQLGRSVADGLRALAEDIQEKSAELCSCGFVHEQKIGSFGDVGEGVFGAYEVKNVKQKGAMEALLREENIRGQWKGLLYIVEGECTAEQEITAVIEELKASGLTERAESKHINVEGNSTVDRFMKERNRAVNELSAAEREALFWGGGRNVLGKNKSIAGKIFPQGEWPAAEFVEKTIEGLKAWGYESRNKTIRSKSIEELALGQMFKCRGQLYVDEARGTITYVPNPVENN